VTPRRLDARFTAFVQRHAESRLLGRVLSWLFTRSSSVRRSLTRDLGAHALLRVTRFVRAEPARSVALAARFNLRAPTFNAGVMLLALDQLRDARFSDETVDLSVRYGLNDNEAVALWADRRFAADRWNYLPGIERQSAPAIIPWAGPLKPWRRSEHVPHRELCGATHARRLAASRKSLPLAESAVR
jgi:lipopolysaccharide biosynthesis glycosyltransferase